MNVNVRAVVPFLTNTASQTCLSWCQAPPRLPLVLNDICDIHGQDLKSQLSRKTVQLVNFDIALLLFFSANSLITLWPSACGVAQMWSSWNEDQQLQVWDHLSLPEKGELLCQSWGWTWIGEAVWTLQRTTVSKKAKLLIYCCLHSNFHSHTWNLGSVWYNEITFASSQSQDGVWVQPLR